VRLVAASTRSAPSGRRVSKSSYRRVHADQRPPRRGSARWPTARFDQATRPAARRHSSVPPPPAPPRSRLERSACPGSGGTITTAASPMRHELAPPARRPRVPACAQAARRGGGVRGVAEVRCAHLNGEHLLVWMGDSSKKNRTSAGSHTQESGEVPVPYRLIKALYAYIIS